MYEASSLARHKDGTWTGSLTLSKGTVTETYCAITKSLFLFTEMREVLIFPPDSGPEMQINVSPQCQTSMSDHNILVPKCLQQSHVPYLLLTLHWIATVVSNSKLFWRNIFQSKYRENNWYQQHPSIHPLSAASSWSGYQQQNERNNSEVFGAIVYITTLFIIDGCVSDCKHEIG